MKQLMSLVFLLVALSNNAIGQQSKIDSLMMLIKEDPGNVALSTLGGIYFKEGKLEEARQLFESCIRQAFGNDAQLCRVYWRIATVYRLNSWGGDSERYYLKSLEKAFAAKDTATYLSASSGLSIVYDNAEQFQKSIDLTEKSIPMEKSTRAIVNDYNNLGTFYLGLGKPYESVSALYKAFEYFNLLPEKDTFTLSTLHHNLSDSFIGLNATDSALKHLEISLLLNTLVRDTVGLIYDRGQYGDYFRLIDNDKEAIKQYNMALRLHESYGFVDSDWDGNDYLFCLDSLSRSYLRIGVLDSAYYFLNLYKARLSKIRDDEAKARLDANYADFKNNIHDQILQIEEGRKHKIQYYAISVVLVLISVTYLAFSSIDKQGKYRKYISVFILLLIFEFMLVWLNPYIAELSGNVPLFDFLINLFVAIMVIPVHRVGEKLFNKVVLDVKFRKIDE